MCGGYFLRILYLCQSVVNEEVLKRFALRYDDRLNIDPRQLVSSVEISFYEQPRVFGLLFSIVIVVQWIQSATLFRRDVSVWHITI
jgi:hypothetical protein